MLGTFGVLELVVVAAIGFVAFNLYKNGQERKSFGMNIIILLAAVAYLLYASIHNTGTSFAD